MDRVNLTRPDDWHIHLRDDDMLPVTVADVSRYFGRTIVMPNLKPPVVTTAQAGAYYQRIKEHVTPGSPFNPLMTLYLTDNTTPDEIVRANDSEWVFAVKYYPAGATTNSESGVTDIRNCYPVLEKMAELGMPLLLHGEVTDAEVDIFDREKNFIDGTLTTLVNDLPQLKIVLEHITTAEAADFVESSPASIAATITPQHLLFNRNHLLAGGIRPHYYCLPVLKRNNHQQALLKAATSGKPCFFLGTDSAPHTRSAKETHCGCAGCYSAPAAIELYAQAFDLMGALDKLEGFASHHGPDFYGLPRNDDSITLQRSPWQIPEQVIVGNDVIIPLMAGQSITWQVVE